MAGERGMQTSWDLNRGDLPIETMIEIWSNAELVEILIKIRESTTDAHRIERIDHHLDQLREREGSRIEGSSELREIEQEREDR